VRDIVTADTSRARRTREVLCRVGVGVVGLAAVAGLTACDPREAGSAAVVGTTRITENSVNADAQTVVRLIGKSGGTPPATDALLRAQVEFRVDDQLVKDAAKEQGVVVTKGQVDALIEQNGGRATLEQQFLKQEDLWLAPSQLDAVASRFLAQQAIQAKLAPGADTTAAGQAFAAYVVDLSKRLGVRVSPRFGVWDSDHLQIAWPDDDLSKPATPVPSASASPTG
jgi:hypothetical protein